MAVKLSGLHGKLFPVCLIVLLTFAACGRNQTETAPHGIIQAGAAAPDFTLADLHGNTVRLSTFRGQIVVLEFWATWCPPCKASVPALVNLHERYRGDGVIIIGISVDSGGNIAKKVEAFSADNHINYPVLLGSDDVARQYGVMSIPATFLIDKEGKLVESFTGYSENMEDELSSHIEKII